MRPGATGSHRVVEVVQDRHGNLIEIYDPPFYRKEFEDAYRFIIDDYQLYEARAAGADAVLLIVAALPDGALRRLLDLAGELGLHTLVEVHDRAELERACATGARVIGINNRDLRTFQTTLATTEALAPLVPADRVVVSESGIFTRADVERVAAAGARAILVGEALMRAPQITPRVRELVGVAR